MSHCFSGDDDADDDKLGQSIDLTSPRVPQVTIQISFIDLFTMAVN